MGQAPGTCKADGCGCRCDEEKRNTFANDQPHPAFDEVDPGLPLAAKSAQAGSPASTASGASRGGAQQRSSLRDCPRAGASTAGAPVAEYQVTLDNLLDCFSLCSKTLPALRAAITKTLRDPRARAHAVAVAAVGQAEAEAVLPSVEANLRAVGALPAHLESMLHIMLDMTSIWNFDATGRVDTAPRLKDKALEEMRVTQEEVGDVRRLACAHVPPAYHSFSRIRELRGRLFETARCAEKPIVIVTVGPPGSGKTHILRERCLPYLMQRVGAPPLDQYVTIDPDYFISTLLENNNSWREMANFLNHESFMCAIGQRRHMLFDHTGKDLVNTCGRVISRLKEANYRVYLCVVLADFQSCRRRVRERERESGRGVPDSYLKLVFEALQKTVPWYLQRQGAIAEAVLVYTNNFGSSEEELLPEVVSGGSASEEMVGRALSILQVPKEA